MTLIGGGVMGRSVQSGGIWALFGYRVEGEFYELRHNGVLGSSLLGKMLVLSLSPYVFISGQWVGHTYRHAIVAGRHLCERDKEVTRGCTEAKRQIGLSNKKPAGSSRERIGTLGRKLLPVATGVGREIYWSSSSRKSSLATDF
jgi:hypothetical protein